jgi:hypothetical protein
MNKTFEVRLSNGEKEQYSCASWQVDEDGSLQLGYAETENQPEDCSAIIALYVKGFWVSVTQILDTSKS